MKFYFDGCSHTFGAELNRTRLDDRYSSLVSKHFDAEEYNISMCGSSNRRIARNLMDHNLSQFDFIVIQMTKRLRTEYYDGQQWRKVKFNTRTNDVGPKNPQKEFWDRYYREIYHDEYGRSDEKIFYTLIRSLLRDIPHMLIGFYQTEVPVDHKYGRFDIPKAKEGHPNKQGHSIIANDIIKYYESIH